MNREYFIRVFKRKRIILIISIMLIINLVDVLSRNIATPLKHSLIVQSAFNENIMVEHISSIGGVLFSFLAFVLISLPLSDCLIEDFENGLIDIKLTKSGKKRYLKKLYLNNFFYGGFFVSLTLIINLIIWMMIRPMWKMNIFNSGNGFSLVMFSSVFVKNPLFFFLLHIVKFFIIGGIIANFSLVINYKFKNKYLGLIAPIVLDILLGLTLSFVVKAIGLGRLYTLQSLATSIYIRLTPSTIIYLLAVILFTFVELIKINQIRDVI